MPQAIPFRDADGAPWVAVDTPDLLTPAAARAFAARLVRAAEAAEQPAEPPIAAAVSIVRVVG